MKETISLALFQTSPIWEKSGQNIDLLSNKIEALTSPVDVIVLPEMFSTGFTMNTKQVAQPMSGATVSWMCEQATRLDTIIVGSVIIEDSGDYYNRMIWARPGKSPLFYDKKHLFTYAGEDLHYTAGDQQLVVDVHGWKIASFICFDLRFPAWCRNTTEQNYDVALYIASWPKARSSQWNALLQARAIENQAFVVAVNRVGVDGNDIAYSGDSQVIGPLGEKVLHTSEEESVNIIRLNSNQLVETRQRFPFLSEADSYQFVGQRPIVAELA